MHVIDPQHEDRTKEEEQKNIDNVLSLRDPYWPMRGSCGKRHRDSKEQKDANEARQLHKTAVHGRREDVGVHVFLLEHCRSLES